MKVIISTPDGTAYVNDQAEKVKVTTPQGLIAILPGHVSLITSLSAGELVIQEKSGNKIFFVDKGLLQVNSDNIQIIADIAPSLEDLNETQINEAQKRAKDLLNNKPENVNMEDIQFALQREINKSKFVKKWKNI
jgi:F-type H+-transporting ATPase subunit epsilon